MGSLLKSYLEIFHIWLFWSTTWLSLCMKGTLIYTYTCICRGHQIIASHFSLKIMLPNEPKDGNWCPLPNRPKDIGTDSCYLMVRRKESDSLHPKPIIYSNNFLEADLNVLVFPTLLFSLHFVTRMLRNEDIFYSGCIITWDIMTSGTLFQHLGHFALGRIVTLFSKLWDLM